MIAGPDAEAGHTMLEQPTLPEHDPHDVVESAVVARLAKNWSQRATVKKPEPQLDD